MGRLDELDLSLKLSKEEEAERLDAGWKRLAGLRLALGAKLPGYALGPPVCVLFEGWDASGKGGAIKLLVAPLDMRHVRVAQFAAPSPDEARTTTCGDSGRGCRGGAAWPCSTAPGTGACWPSGWRATQRRSSGSARTARSSSSSAR
jgi:hypothetical protein